MKTIFLGLGSNIGDREQALNTAIQKLHRSDLHIRQISSVYETAAVDYTAQPDFLNCVLQAETTLFPMRLLHRIQSIEREMGRKRLIDKGPRTIDIDILLYGSVTIQAAQLQIPHPHMHERRFVLEPLCELAPDLLHPIHRRSIRTLLASVEGQRVLRTTRKLAMPQQDSRQKS